MDPLNNLKSKRVQISSEVREKSMTYIAGGLGIVVGLAWNEAIKGLIEYVYPASSANSLFAKFLYAVVITIIVVIVTMYIVRTPEKKG
ncbi:MAG: DUF5654 family protein [bacterium]|nr:DUF5654 family protein [bacterium]